MDAKNISVAQKDEVVGLRGEQVVIRVNAPPVDGKANAALVAFAGGRQLLDGLGLGGGGAG